MAALTPRASGLWEDDSRISDSYFSMNDHDPERLPSDEDSLTPLDITLNTIGMGPYQWVLVFLCGFGWMADNMWLQAISIILPRVQRQFDVPDSYIGVVSSCMFTGMGIGALAWGACSDLMGRTFAFNATLLFTSVFGVLASFANSFTMLCVLFFLLGTAIGGSMPTVNSTLIFSSWENNSLFCLGWSVGTLLLEQLPKKKQYLVTALSVFFSFGAVLSAVVALAVVPSNSCSSDPACDVDAQNGGWKYLLAALGLLTLVMFFARIVFFKLHESPRFLVSAGRPQEALEALQLISRYNGHELAIDLGDVSDIRPTPHDSPTSAPAVLFGAEAAGRLSLTLNTPSPPNYNSTDASPTNIDSPPGSPKDRLLRGFDPVALHSPRPRTPLQRRPSSVYQPKTQSALPRWIHSPLWAWVDRVSMVLSPEWIKTTLVVWAIWCSMSLGFTMFNVFLPKLLEGLPTNGTSLTPKSIEESLWDIVIFTLGGCPGAVLGAYLVETRLGRRGSLAASTFITAFFMVVFANVESQWAVRGSTVVISLSATTMWAVLYGWTPEIFSTSVRGSACGIASALSRVGGMIAPVLGGILLMIDRRIPVYTSVVVFLLAGVCVLVLREDAGRDTKEPAMASH